MKGTRVFFGIVLILLVASVTARDELPLDFDWRFLLLNSSALPSCAPNAFPLNMNGIQCENLNSVEANTAEECARQCCNDGYCQVYQWCPVDAKFCSPPGSCWTGAKETCYHSREWISQARNSTPPTPSARCQETYCNPSFDDSKWRLLNIPHDFVIEGTFSPKAEENHGYLPKGVGWYRKHFSIPNEYKGTKIWIYFDGVYRDSDVYLNGYLLGHHDSGYTSFYYYIDEYLLYGGADNVLAVKANAMQDEGWWYEGGGIYRHAKIYVSEQLRSDFWGIYAHSEVTGSISWNANGPVATTAVMTVDTTVVNDAALAAPYTIFNYLLDARGNYKTGTNISSTGTLNAKSKTTITQAIRINDVNLWDVESPYLYTLVTTVVPRSGLSDQVKTTVGVRTFRFDKDEGLILNGRSVKVKGLCNHQDFAGVGTAVPDRVNEFRVTKLKEMGANGWRMSHNPPNSELLDFTDKHGILVWDENRNFGPVPQWLEDVAVLPMRDRNHPSIVIWSLCNEVGCIEVANDTKSLTLAHQFKEVITSIDPTRPVSAAWNAPLEDLLYGWGPKVLDLQGVNYNYGEIDPYHAKYPEKPMISSETASCTGARGIYVTNDTATHKSILSANGCAIEWWTADATRKFIAGGFSWTGFDYKGEPTPYSWPDINSNFGTIDIAGFPKDTFYYYQSWWTNDKVLHVFPPWNEPPPSGGLDAGPCSAADANQYFKFTGSSTKASQIETQSGLCVDATCNSISTGCAPLKLSPCDNGNQNQFFYLTNKATFQNVKNSGCIDLWDSGEGPNVGVYECDGGLNQQWRISGSQIISQDVEKNADRCLTTATPKQVWTYSNAYAVELFINGASQGKQLVPVLQANTWNVKYTPGTIEVRGYDNSGKTISSKTLSTPGAPYSITLEVDVGSSGIVADRQDAAMLRAIVTDRSGNIVPDASNLIQFSVTGPAAIIGVGNGDPSCHQPDKATYRSAFNGLARVIIQSNSDQRTSPNVVVEATSSGLVSGRAAIPVLQA